MSRRRLRTSALSAAALVCGLVLTGCSGGTTSGSASGGSTPGATSAPAPSSSDGAGGPSSDGSSASGGSSSSGGTASGGTASSGGSSPSASSGGSASGGTATESGAPAAARPCRTAGLGFAIAPGSGAQAVGEQGAVVVRLTNKSGAPCTLKGYPGVDLVGDTTWSLPRQTSQTPRPVTLKPGATTTFTLTYQSYEEGSGVELTPKRIVVTPPGETHSTTLTWDFSSVLLQDGATHPGTYVGPVGGN
ncbi:DUF4232 domain-containing protein [Streptomyces sp. NPDC059534]|uniref:DUF4232 domain-containing protein n=1 Tax=Streptomyces sp. NPDC059534 TaxID=3346859 RepID=UPI0036B9485F